MKKLLFISIFLAIVLFCGNSLIAQDSSYKVIVNKSNPVSSMTKKEISNMFLKKVSKWGNGIKIVVVDLIDTSSVRSKFSRDIHGRKVSAIKSYWQKQIFSGREVPPAEKKSDREVLTFVTNNPGAIGYIAASTSTSNYQVKTLEIN